MSKSVCKQYWLGITSCKSNLVSQKIVGQPLTTYTEYHSHFTSVVE